MWPVLNKIPQIINAACDFRDILHAHSHWGEEEMPSILHCLAIAPPIYAFGFGGLSASPQKGHQQLNQRKKSVQCVGALTVPCFQHRCISTEESTVEGVYCVCGSEACMGEGLRKNVMNFDLFSFVFLFVPMLRYVCSQGALSLQSCIHVAYRHCLVMIMKFTP